MQTTIAAPALEINLISYNIHGQKLREGIIKIDFEKEKVIFPSGKEYSVINDYEFTYKILKGTIKAAGGINPLTGRARQPNCSSLALISAMRGMRSISMPVFSRPST